ncbi:hypothetical protein HYX13_03410 [Candidatus Woesearchaeota archaeon]|nr:hypothetical protein [Candidatus Woesearchaeota archaeon]
MNTFKFPSIKEVYNGENITHGDVFVFEKIDGANVSLRKEGQHLVPWSRGGPIGGARRYYFDAFRDFVFNKLAVDTSLYDLPEELVLFGEFTHYGSGHITYDHPHMDKMHLIGIYNAEGNTFLHPTESQVWIDLLHLDEKLPFVPLLHHGNLSDQLASSLLHRSRLSHGSCEGIVVHEYGSQFSEGVRMRKRYHPDFREVDETKEGADKYLTLRRFVKAGQKLLAAKKEINLDALLAETVRDVCQEASLKPLRVYHTLEKHRERIIEEVLPLFKKDKEK